MEQPLVILERQDRVALVTINRPEKLNALNTGVISALASLMEELNKDTHIRAVVLTGADCAVVRAIGATGHDRRSTEMKV